jgi:hypothetical protein
MKKDELIKAREEVLQWLESQEESLRYYDEVKDQKSYVLVLDKREVNRTLLKALDAQIKACDVPKLEGFGHTLKDTRIVENEIRCMSNYEAKQVLEAAREYHKMTGGE